MYENLDKLLEDYTAEGDAKEYVKHFLEELIKSKDIVLADASLKNCKFSRGDIVQNIKTGDIGFIVGALNSYPKDIMDPVAELKKSKNPRYLMIILNPNTVNTFVGKPVLTQTNKPTSLDATGLFTVRYPSESSLALLIKEKKKTPLQDVKEFCTYHCIVECDNTCPLKKHGFGSTE